MRLKILLVFLMFISLSNIYSQNIIGFYDADDYQFKFGVEYENNAASDLNNNFLLTFLNSKILTDNIINEAVKNDINEINKAGNISHLSAYFIEKQSDMFYLGFEFGNNNIYAASFNKDLFKLVFQGNTDFIGKNADLSNLNYLNIKYNYISALLLFKISNNIFIRLKPSFINSLNHQNIYTNNLKVYTDSLGKYIDINGFLNLDFASSKANYGSAISLAALYKSNSHYFSLNINDIGFVNIINNISYTFKNLRWEGITIDNIFEKNLSINVEDSLINFISDHKTIEDKIVYLPMNISFEYIYKLNEKFDLGIYSSYYLGIYSSVFLQPKLYHHINRNWHLTYNVSYGEYSSFNAGLNILLLQNKWSFEFGSRYFSALLMQSDLSGFGGYLSVNYKLSK